VLWLQRVKVYKHVIQNLCRLLRVTLKVNIEKCFLRLLRLSLGTKWSYIRFIMEVPHFWRFFYPKKNCYVDFHKKVAYANLQKDVFRSYLVNEAHTLSKMLQKLNTNSLFFIKCWENVCFCQNCYTSWASECTHYVSPSTWRRTRNWMRICILFSKLVPLWEMTNLISEWFFSS